MPQREGTPAPTRREAPSPGQGGRGERTCNKSRNQPRSWGERMCNKSRPAKEGGRSSNGRGNPAPTRREVPSPGQGGWGERMCTKSRPAKEGGRHPNGRGNPAPTRREAPSLSHGVGASERATNLAKAKESGGGGGQKLRRLRWFCPPRKQSHRRKNTALQNFELVSALHICAENAKHSQKKSFLKKIEKISKKVLTKLKESGIIPRLRKIGA